MDTESRYIAYENIIHDIKTPICIISNALEVMSSYTDRPEWFDFYSDILNKNTYKVYKLINDAADVGKILNGNFEVKLAYHDVVFLTKEVVVSASLIADRKKIKINFVSTVSEKRTAVDNDIYGRIVLNLIANAIKFTRVNGNIDVKFEDGGDYFIVTIRDDGIGIENEKFSHMFTRYYMGKRNNRNGSGLGLNIVKDLTEVLDGEISFFNNANSAGATVALKIPLNETEREYEDINYLYDFYYNNMTQVELSYAE